MPTYCVCDLVLRSNILFPELPPARGKKPACVLKVLKAPPRAAERVEWFHRWHLPDGEPWLLFGRKRRGHLLRFPRLGDFLVSLDGAQVRCRPRKAIPLDTVRHLFLDQVFPLLLSKQGRLVLHASAVRVPGGAIAFLGETGQGKSTLASSFSKRGFPFLTDDCLLLEQKGGQLVGIPSYPGLRLWPKTVSVLFSEAPPVSRVAHYTTKKRLGWLPFCSTPVSLRRIYLLARPEAGQGATTISIRPLSPRDAFVQLVKYAYLIDIGDRAVIQREFEHLSQVVRFPLYYRLAFKRDFALLPKVQDAILENAKL